MIQGVRKLNSFTEYFKVKNCNLSIRIKKKSESLAILFGLRQFEAVVRALNDTERYTNNNIYINKQQQRSKHKQKTTTKPNTSKQNFVNNFKRGVKQTQSKHSNAPAKTTQKAKKLENFGNILVREEIRCS